MVPGFRESGELRHREIHMRREMRAMNVIPQVETTELSDAGLDSVSGGLAGGVSGGGLLQAGPVNVDLCADAFAVASADGVVAGVSVHAAAH
jgi:hypothetical protein